MTLDERVKNLENLVYALINRIDNDKQYTNADINGTRQSVTDITPWTASKTAYIDDTEVAFTDAPQGNVSVYMTDKDGQNVPCTFERVYNGIKVAFEKRNSLAEVNISII